MPHVSVVIPAHNRAHTLERALRSVLSQEHVDLEVVVGDDASRDDTTTLLTRHAEADPRVHWVTHATRRGAQAARNSAIRAARGRYVAFLDSDDEWLPGSLLARLNRAEETGRPVVHAPVLREQAGGRTLMPVPPLESDTYRLLLEGPGPMLQAMLVERELLFQVGLLDESVISFQEWDTAIRLARHAPFAFVSEPAAVWHVGGKDTISRDLARAAAGYEQVVRLHEAEIRRHASALAMSRHWRTAARMYADAGRRSDALRCWRRCVTALPWSTETLEVVSRRVRRRLGLDAAGR
ncbi:MAG: glycosyltransferase family 2 protein [Myxococcota bacterium]